MIWVSPHHISKVTQLALKRHHQMVARSSLFETNIIIHFFQQFTVFVKLLPNGKVSHSQRFKARSTPSTFTWGKVAARRIKVGAEYPFCAPKILSAVAVQAQSFEIGPTSGPVPAVWD
jgi:hypothetical protein